MTVNISELIRNHIEQQFDNSYDYTSKENRKKDLEDFCMQNGLDPEKTRTLFQKVFRKIVKQKKLNPNDYDIGTKTKMPLIGSDMNAIIEPVPQSSPLVVPPQSVSAEIAPAPALTSYQYDEFSVSATLDGFYQTVRALFAPAAELLTDEEKSSIGKMWQPLFNRFITEDWQIVGVAVMGTSGIFMPKIIKARKIKKEKDAKKKLELKNNSQTLSKDFANQDRTRDGDNDHG